MIEGFAGIGLVCTFFVCLAVMGLFLEWSIEKFKRWRKYNCKFKCLCKHKYKIYWLDVDGEMGIECTTCGKKTVLHFDGESLKEYFAE